ncbi:hypothetical protein F503_04172 [Ophiostoma piceae UAMH 11346]|uniref:Uncharacterized protein n=1 Tax=Ophiostoma piceae (strain UAMH 11346) TaxID=1262450 RepID=S3D598_OPHP1|nr:hypothetical protein F503_04172 [Ophiostoma piceae UAMH 11346]
MPSWLALDNGAACSTAPTRAILLICSTPTILRPYRALTAAARTSCTRMVNSKSAEGHPLSNFVYVSNRNNKSFGAQQDSVGTYAINPATGALANLPVGTVSVPGNEDGLSAVIWDE